MATDLTSSSRSTAKTHLGSESPILTQSGMIDLIRELYPICRSITGNGVRESLRILQRYVPLEIHEVPSGTRVFDWTVPDEWNIRDAWIKNRQGEKIVDFRESNLHVVNYSVPIQRFVRRDELLAHVFSIPEQPDRIPYRTSYYNPTWGFCVTHDQLQTLTDDDYEICIDSTLEPGSLTYGEYAIKGRSRDEILLTAHVCHPSMCNDNLSGVTVATSLARELAETDRHYTIRVLFIPGTIGSITWLARNPDRVPDIRHGLSLVCLGDSAELTYKKTIGGSAEIDHAARRVLEETERPFAIIDYFPYGYDERQFNAPGFRLPFGSIMRGRHGQFSEYHTSADNLEFISASQLEDAKARIKQIISMLDRNRRYRNLAPYGEPQLGKRGIYRAIGGSSRLEDIQVGIMWVLALSDGRHTLLDIAERSKVRFDTISRAADLLTEHHVIEELPRKHSPRESQ